MIELLSPAGSLEALKAAVQNGADSVYLGAGKFNARAFASNFDDQELKEAIAYAKLRNVKIHLTLNTLLKDEEIEDALELANKAISFGVDAIIVQDLGLATLLKQNFPDVVLHASTQMTAHNLEGVRKLEKLGFSRVVLSRELSLEDIQFICSNAKAEIETFIHGALCISYSGQCLFSSMVGGRSGNRGTCAQPCRLPYSLIEKTKNKEKTIDQGYLLSPKDLCGLEYIPQLIESGVSSFKLEGRMKSPEYVATVTRIYRKYIDLAYSDKPYNIDPEDKTELLQLFNRGGFSNGHLASSSNTSLVYPIKPNNMGLPLGSITKINANKGLITLTTSCPIQVGDQLSFEKEDKRYTISEITVNKKTVQEATEGMEITIGRMKGNLHIGDKIYKLSSKTLLKTARASFENGVEHKKIPLSCSIELAKGKPIVLNVKSINKPNNIYNNIDVTVSSDVLPQEANNRPLDKQRVVDQLSKTNDTPYEFKKISVQLEENLFLPKISILNQLRRQALEKIEESVLSFFQSAPLKDVSITLDNLIEHETKKEKSKEPRYSLLLNYINPEEDYKKLEGIDYIYIPLRCFVLPKYAEVLKQICNKFNVYVYLPTIIKPNYRNLLSNALNKAISSFDIKGFVLSNISHITLMEDIKKEYPKRNFDFISNYTMNVFNQQTAIALKEQGINRITLSAEASKKVINSLLDNPSYQKELIVYGNLPLMTSNYCLLGKANKCYPTCQVFCKNDTSYYLKDRLGFKFRIVPDNIQTITTIYNSKITSIKPSDFKADCYRIDILDESIDKINNIISTVRNGNRLEGEEYTNGNLNRDLD